METQSLYGNIPIGNSFGSTIYSYRYFISVVPKLFQLLASLTYWAIGGRFTALYRVYTKYTKYSICIEFPVLEVLFYL